MSEFLLGMLAAVPDQTVRSQKHREHIPPHRIWNYLYVDGEFSAQEHDHILTCPPCLRTFILCLNSDNFGHVLKELKPTPERRSA